MKKKIFTLAAAAALFCSLSFITACGNGSTPETNGENNEAQSGNGNNNVDNSNAGNHANDPHNKPGTNYGDTIVPDSTQHKNF